VTSNSGPATGSYGIKSLTAKGTVRSSLFDVKSGNVGPVTVGRFIDSQLYLDYTPHDPGSQTFLTGGAFGAGAFKLTAFKTTAVPLGDANNPLNWAFANSEIAAEVLGAVTLSGVRTGNGGTAFGIKAKAAGAVKVLAADDPSVLLNVNLPFDSQLPYEAVAGDFYLLDV
jgi:3D (Asp-Asp-Asp) domain-containing protein